MGNPYVATLYKQVSPPVEPLGQRSDLAFSTRVQYRGDDGVHVGLLADGRVSLWLRRQPVIHRHRQGVGGSYETPLHRRV